METVHRHYVTVDERCRITNGFSDAFRQPSDSDICITAKGSYQFRLYPDGEENPQLLTCPQGIPIYKLKSGVVVKRTDEEIEADIAEIPHPEQKPSRMDLMEAQMTYTAMMTDTLLEV